MNGKRLCVVAISLLLVAAVPARAGATPPQRSDTITGTYDDEVLAECGGFDVVRDGAFTVTRTTFFDAAGAPARMHVRITRDAIVQNSVTGKTARDDAVWTLTVDLVSGTVSGSGKYENITVPGYGSVRYDIGHFVESAEGGFFAGRSSWPDEASLCAALA